MKAKNYFCLSLCYSYNCEINECQNALQAECLLLKQGVGRGLERRRRRSVVLYLLGKNNHCLYIWQGV